MVGRTQAWHLGNLDVDLQQLERKLGLSLHAFAGPILMEAGYPGFDLELGLAVLDA